MATFSEIVDAVAQDTGRGGGKSLPSVIRAVNNTIRDFIGNNDSSQRSEFKYTDDKARFTPPTAFAKLSIPLPTDTASIETVMTDLDQLVHSVKPGINSLMMKGKNRYYIADGCLHISACFKESVIISYFKVRRNLRYYPMPMRLLKTSDDFSSDCVYQFRYPKTNEWLTYNPRNPDMKKSFDNHVNWVTDLHADVIELGAASSLHNRSGNTEAGRSLFSQYRTQKDRIISARLLG